MSHLALIETLRMKGITDERVLEAMLNTPRKQFVPSDIQQHAYEDVPLSIGHQQTISQPYIVATMTQTLMGGRSTLDKVLEIGTGSGYQAAVLAQLARQVYTVERLKVLYERSRSTLAQLGLKNVHCLYADGSGGWPEHAPYDGIIVTAVASQLPLALGEQLKIGGRLVLPLVTTMGQQLYLIQRTAKGFEEKPLESVRFVPLLGGKE